jgi:DNA-binding CsgD family transcriptional regulator
MRAIDHRWGVARAQLGLGDLARVRGDFADARQRYMEALAYLREINARPEIARCLSGLGRVATEAGATALAREHLTESLRLSRDIGTRIGVARGLEAFAALAVREGEPERGVLLAAAATALRETAGLPGLSGARAERYLAPARRLGDAAVAELWARGLELSPTAAIDVALEPTAAPVRPAEPAAAPPSVLTPRELQIAELVADGRSNKAIGAELVISPATVARHIANIMAKLGFRSRAQIAVWVAGRRLAASAPCYRSRASWARASSTVSSAAGSASSRSSGIGLPLSTERPYVPASIRASAPLIASSRLRRSSATASSLACSVSGSASSP